MSIKKEFLFVMMLFCLPILLICSDKKSEKKNIIQNSSGVKILSKQEIIKTAMQIANYFEELREFPDTLTLDGQTYPVQQLAILYTDAIRAINENKELGFALDTRIAPPDNYCPSIEIDSSVYENPLSKNEYLSFCSQIKANITKTLKFPESFVLRNSSIRSVETVYLLAHIIRYYDFYGQLPDFVEIRITPKGLVPWLLSQNQRKYISMNSCWSSIYLQTNNSYNIGKYEPFKIAKRVIGNETNSYNAAKLLYDHVIDRWHQGGYKIWIKPFGEPDYAYSNYRFNLSNSASQSDKINMLIRSVGLPCTEQRMYDDNAQTWINIDVHKPFGSEPYGWLGNPYPWDFVEPLDKNSTLVNRISEIISKNDNNDIDEKYIWINPADIKTYGADYILTKCKSAGINNIIITIKSSNGFFYYPTKYNSTTSFYGNNEPELWYKFKYDVLTPITSKAGTFGINILPAVNILNDFYMAVDSWHYEYIDSLHHWMQYKISYNIDWGNPLNNMGISACVESFKDSTSKWLKEIANLPGISGIVLGSLYMNTTSYALAPDGNPNCKCFYEDSLWQSKLLNKYAADLTGVIKSENSNLKVIISSYPKEFSYYPSFNGMVNEDEMKNIADAYMLIVGYTQWLNPTENYAMPVVTPNPFLLKDYVKKLSNNSQKPIIVSTSIKDEWIYTPDFYTGLSKDLTQAGASGICFHNFNSLDGEWGPAFDAFQYSTIESMNFTKSVLNTNPLLVADESKIDFGKVSIGENVNKKICIKNNGQGNLTINEIKSEDSSFVVSQDYNNIALNSFDKIIIDVICSPKIKGIANSRLMIKSDVNTLYVDLVAVCIDTLTTAIQDYENKKIPKEYSLQQNYPNPFNPVTTIKYQIPKSSKVSLVVFNVLGQKVFKLVDEDNEAGFYEVKFDGNKLASGIYFYRMQAGNFVETKKLILLK